VTGINQPDPATWYEIRVRGHLDSRWAAWFDGLHLHHQDDGTTLVRGPVADQAALHGLLERMRDLGLPLISIVPTARPAHLPSPSPTENRPTENRRRTT
jgi:hypothetical protein